MLRRSVIGVIAATALLAPATGAAPEPPAPTAAASERAAERLTDLTTTHLGEPLTPREAELAVVFRHAVAHGAIACTFDPGTGVVSYLFPPGSTPPRPPDAPVPVRYVVGKHRTALLDEVVAAVMTHATSPGGDGYSYGISIDAAAGVVAVDTTAPPWVTDVLAARYPAGLRFTRSLPGSAGFSPASAGAAADLPAAAPLHG
jgi:hypothetical protein